MEEEECEVSSVLNHLILAATEISEIDGFKHVIKRQCFDLSRRIRFLAPLFQELLDVTDAVPNDAVSALLSLKKALASAKELLHFCCRASQVFMILEREQIKCKFNDLAFNFEEAIGKISCDKLDISEEVKEQVALVTAQFGRARELFDPPDLQLYDNLLSICNQSYDVIPEQDKLHIICKKLHFTNVGDIKQELIALDKMVVDMGGHFEKSTQDMSTVLKKIEDFILTESADVIMLSSDDSSTQADESYTKLCSQSLVIPDEFRCPISLELMKDPVIISTGQTYERACIKKWLEAGHGTCPKTQQILSSSVLIPNHVLYILISNWCEANGVEPPKRTEKLRLCKATSDGSSEFIDIDTLLSRLTSSDIEDQRCTAEELRLLAKRSSQNRILIAEAGAIPLLVDLLYVPDKRTQEHAVTVLLNLSICGNNKERIMASEAVPGIVHVLKNGVMEARENAAATLFSLSALNENKVLIGASGAIKALVTLFCEGSQRGKMDAATALFNLCLYQGNKGRSIRAGIMPKLTEMVTEPGEEMRDVALALMALLVSHPEGKAVVGSMNAMPTLVDIVTNGSPKNKENATSVLVYLCIGDPMNVSSACSLGVINPLLDLAENGSERGKRKAAQLLELIGILRSL
ncbi:U-box domain-containing protein 13-like [Arachis stenosperma]|uniref:U-box domain-containing protein 13-like n=1 Tax=Arachis stenosperma TaxID=217475 RepID=UPI0025AD5008|nr:U-box domain-containing protein 13-like [Arachis stenosperma]